MKRIKEFMDDMTTQGWITTAIIGALVIIVLIGTFVTIAGNPGSSKFSMKKDVKVVNVDKKDFNTDRFINRATDNVFDKETPKPQTISGTPVKTYTPPAVSYSAQKEEVKIALIIAENEYDVDNIIEGICGNVYMVTAYVPGPTVLTNSFRALFGDKVFGDFLPGNIIPTYHPDLTFKEVVITNGVARIYLGGKFHETQKDSCDTALAIAQLTETAESYPNVKSVEIYLGGKKVN